MPESVIFIIVLTAIAGIATAIALYFVGNQKLTLNVNPADITGVENAASPIGDLLDHGILDELKKLPASDESKGQITRALKNIFHKELDKQKTAVRQKYEVTLRKQEQQLTTMTQQYQTVSDKYQKVNAEKTQTESIVRSIAEGLIVVNNQGEVLLINPAAEKLLGVEKETRLGKPLLSEVKEDQLISMVKQGTEKQGKEIVLNSGNDNTKKILRTSTAVIENENGQTVGMVSVLTDVTKQKEVEELKARFVSNVSHELRTPIVTIQKALSLLNDQTTGPLNETQQKFIDISQRNLENLSHLINDLLDMAKIEAGKMRLAFAPARAEEVISGALESLSPWASSKGIRLEKKISAGLPTIEMDTKRVHQVLVNLIGNAIKFTPPNGTITTAAIPSRDSVEINVTDTGVGIAKQDLPKVFDRFQQVGERIASDISGTGLGLSISKEIIELHGGRIWVESEPGKGATFRFTLPFHRKPPARTEG